MGYLSSLEKQYKELYPALVIFANKYVKDQDTAKDIVQEVFVKLVSQPKTIQEFKPYLFRAVKNGSLNHLRLSSKLISTDAEEPLELTYFDNAIEESEFTAYVYQIIEQLPPATQKIFKMNRFKGMSNQDIADELQLSKRTVELQISNALKFLRQHLKKSNNTYSQYLSLLF